MRSKPTTIKIPWKLVEVFEKHAQELGYESIPQFMLWTAIYSIMVRSPHRVTAPLAQSTPAIQDAVIDDIVERYERGESSGGAYFENLISEVLVQLGYGGKEDVVEALIAARLKRGTKKAL
jgi:hypothetical protein